MEHTDRWRPVHWLALLLGLTCAAIGLGRLLDATDGLRVTRAVIDGVPVTEFRPRLTPPGGDGRPAVVIAHGFAGSQQLMHPFALTLARAGIIAITFDFPGHGRNSTPLAGEIGTPERAAALLATLGRVVAHARGLPDFNGRLALLGHSMAGDIIVRHAGNDPALDALVAVSPYLSQPLGLAGPRRLLFIYGGLEHDMILQQGREAVAALAGIAPELVQPGVTYGDGADGRLRRLVIADGVEHIGVLYSRDSLAAAVDWLRPALGLDGAVRPILEVRGPWLALYFVGVVLLAWPLTRLLPRVVSDGPGTTPPGAGLSWRQLLPVAVVPAIMTPVILMPVPADFLPISIGDYIALHFGLYGLLTAVGLALTDGWRRRGQAAVQQPPARLHGSAFLFTVALVALAEFLALTLPADCFIASFIPGPWRFDALLVLFASALLWALADEWLTRGPGAPRGAYALTKALFLVSLMLAVALNLSELFFLVLVVPAILVLFVVYGLISGWLYRRTGHPAVAAITNALAFAGAVAVTFPVLG